MESKKLLNFVGNVELRKGTNKDGQEYEFYVLSLDIPFDSDVISISLKATDFTSSQLLQTFLKSKYNTKGGI